MAMFKGGILSGMVGNAVLVNCSANPKEPGKKMIPCVFTPCEKLKINACINVKYFDVSG